MGTTTKLSLPWPAGTAKLKDGYNSIRLLAEAVEGALLSPLLVTDGTDAPNYGPDKTGEPGWDVTDQPDRKRGGWDANGSVERLVIPSKPGFYLVTASVRFGGKAEPDWYEVSIRTRKEGDDVGTGTQWAGQRVELPADSSTYTQLSVASVVRVADTTPRTGIAIRMAYNGSTAPPTADAGANKLRIHWLSAL